ncbi:diphosphoinositol-polyphosphate diphosphatase [Malassezia vespertilionis]|uniref:diphosphoinositol-polyphosphate diphosphatase n=1 Tax=Malassezia vespertilionis TaxID=2020962 RepID=UPI0024B2419B|nr:diphosphoinositol-polyphosphate diphosphatase [Malassezia vespertilionis]WFD08306.1 diphosphoinositol-polyphosphate diphosphatase [Malassezia vespertilionis]
MTRSEQAVPRRVAIALAVLPEPKDLHNKVRVCVVSSRKHKNAWVLPKGGVEAGESAREAAMRELWEEVAGVRASGSLPPWSVVEPVVEIIDTKPHSRSPTSDVYAEDYIPSTVYTVHEFAIAETELQETWPENCERVREFVTLAEAQRRVQWRRGLPEALAKAPVTAYVSR